MVLSSMAGFGSCKLLLLGTWKARETGVLAGARRGEQRGTGHQRRPVEVWNPAPWRTWNPVPWRMWNPTPWSMCLMPVEAGSVLAWGRNTLNPLNILSSCSPGGHAELAHPAFGDSWQSSVPSLWRVSEGSLSWHAGLWQSGA